MRFAQLEEVIQICRLMWTQHHPSFDGAHYSISDAAAPPLPDVVPPICIGAAGEKIGLPLVGRQADMWNSAFRGEEDWKRKVGIVHDSAVATGRDPKAIEIGTTLETPLPTSDEESERLLERVVNLAANGVQHFTMDFGHPDTAEHVHRFAEQVIRPARAT